WAGYEDALLAAGLDPKAQFVRAGVPSKAGGYEAARDLLAKGERLPPALLVWGGTMAWGAIRAFREAGVKVPGDVRIATFGSRFFLRNYPGITTAVAEAKSLGGEAVAALGRRIENPDLPPRRIRLPMPLVLGESSTGTPMEEAGMGEPPA
ncbi:MAG: LacI family transcriptional regulator, partial [Planctomycetota bacterium]|nr:LacI family transcriptional regulator [Planctomycetota bacterium]